nr:Dihydrofolate reductase [uncultured bacterium]
MGKNRVIGRDGGLPWRLSSDMKRFKALTMGKPIVMGRKTWDSLGRPLPGRPHVVVTRNADFSAEGVERAESLDAAIERAATLAQESGADEICIIGGGEIYAQAMEKADSLHVTHVEIEPEGDTVFPEIDPATWECIDDERLPAGEKDSHATRYAVYRRRRAV